MAGKGKADFESELKLISIVNHRNIIRLLGYAVRGSELLLVCEYMANGSLDKFLYGEFPNTKLVISCSNISGDDKLFRNYYYYQVKNRGVSAGNNVLL